MAESKIIIKRLYRSNKDRMIAGVCGGIAEYYEMDPTLIRLLWAGLTILTAVFPGILIYILAWVIIPEKR